MSLETFSDLPMVINVRKYQNLRHYLDRALRIVDPDRTGGLNLLPTISGIGDGHGSNVIISNESIALSILYVDYEVAGIYTVPGPCQTGLSRRILQCRIRGLLA